MNIPFFLDEKLSHIQFNPLAKRNLNNYFLSKLCSRSLNLILDSNFFFFPFFHVFGSFAPFGYIFSNFKSNIYMQTCVKDRDLKTASL